MRRLSRAAHIAREDGPLALAAAVRAYVTARAIAHGRRGAQELGLTAHMPGDRLDDIKRRLSTESPVIVDGGANVGQTIEAFLATFENPVIHAFEPIPELATRLEREYGTHPGVEIHHLALGPEQRPVSFNVTARPGQSSVLSPSQSVDRYAWRRDVTRQVEVEQVRVDEILDEVDVLKLDLQGYELEALRGATGLFDAVSVILVEVEFVRLYEDAPLFHEVTSYLQEHDFRVFNLYGLTTDDASQLMYADAMYVPGEYGSPGG